MSDWTPEQLDEWRHAEAGKVVVGMTGSSWFAAAFAEYRRLVREDVQPPAEPDQDTLDLRSVLAVLNGVSTEAIAAMEPLMTDFAAAKAALSKIKDRVRKEAIMALPDEASDELKAVAGKVLRLRNTLAPIPGGGDWLIAIKKVFGQ